MRLASAPSRCRLQGGDRREPFKVAGEALRGALPDCRVVIMPGERHAAMDTATDLFTAEGIELPGGAGAGGLRSVAPV